MKQESAESRIKGCLIGSVIGAELGFARVIQRGKFDKMTPKDMSRYYPEPLKRYRENRYNVSFRKATPFIDAGVRAYLRKKGRVMPEDFAAVIKDDQALAGPVNTWYDVHTVQELLKEGMHPRLSGVGNAPCGNICAAMPAVGIYHHGYPEYAYLDGMELASVVQPRLGADWAGLCAAAVAAALAPEANAESVVESVLDIAFHHCRDVFYRLNERIKNAAGKSESEFPEWWLNYGGREEWCWGRKWIAWHPLFFVLPLLNRGAGNAHRLFSWLLAPWNHGSYITAVLAGAVAGALYGERYFPVSWRRRVKPIVNPWLAIIAIVRKRQRREQQIVSEIRFLHDTPKDQQNMLFDKVYGGLLAGAIGNAMGSPVEGKTYWEIERQYRGGIRTVLQPERLEGEDDNQAGMMIVDTYLKRNGLPVMARELGATWKESMNRDHYYPYCMGHAYELIEKGWDPRIIGHWSVVTGSTVMCMEPVGMYHAGDSEFAFIDAMAVSFMYQRGLDVITAAILAAAVAEAFKPTATVDSICRTALKYAPASRMITFDKRSYPSVREYLTACLVVAEKYNDVFAARRELYRKCLFYNMIDPLEVLGLSLAIFKIAGGDVRKAAIGGANLGRDADTIAGRVAMLSGTLQGAGNVPQDWIALFKPEVLERIKRKAHKLTGLIRLKKMERLERRRVACG